MKLGTSASTWTKYQHNEQARAALTFSSKKQTRQDGRNPEAPQPEEQATHTRRNPHIETTRELAAAVCSLRARSELTSSCCSGWELGAAFAPCEWWTSRHPCGQRSQKQDRLRWVGPQFGSKLVLVKAVPLATFCVAVPQPRISEGHPCDQKCWPRTEIVTPDQRQASEENSF